MTRQISTKCDGCGDEAAGENPRNWMKVQVEINGQDTKDNLDVCSFECISRYALRRANEFKNP